MVLLSFILYSYFLNDGSFNSKFHILYKTYEEIQFLSFSEILFGIGSGNSHNILGIDAHLIFLKYLIETGVIGLLIFLIFVGIYIYKYNSHILSSVLILGLSYFGTPFLFVPLALLANIYDIKKKELKCKIN